MYDAVIIGGGHNGLVAAWYLAAAGRKVIVLERRAIVGGACTTEEIVPGARCSTTSYVCSMLHPAVIEDLELRRRGFDLLPAKASFMPLPDGRHLLLGLGAERDRESLTQFSAADARALPAFEDAVSRAAAFLRPVLDATPLDPLRPTVAALRDGARLARRFRRLGEDDQRLVVKVLSMSAADLLAEWFESPVVIGALAAGGTVGLPGSPSTPGTAFVLLHYALGDMAGTVGGWGHVRGGMGAITTAMAEACKDVGVEIRTSAEVAEIVVAGGRARGVRLKDGERVDARLTLSNADPKRTFTKLVRAEALAPSFARAMSAYRTTGTSAKVNLVLDRPPDFSALPGSGEHLHGLIAVIGDGIPYLERAFGDFQHRQLSREPYLDISIPSFVDDTLCADGMHVMSVSMKYAPYVADVDDAAYRQAIEDRVLDTIERYAPGTRSAVMASQVISPRDFESEYGLTGGNVVHGDMSADQLFSMRPALGASGYATPIESLYLCGAGAHPGGGVTGAPGRNAARTVLRHDRRPRRLWRRVG